MRRNEIDKDFIDTSWREMRSILDRELPVRSRRRPLIWLFFFGLGLLGAWYFSGNILHSGNENHFGNIPDAKFDTPGITKGPNDDPSSKDHSIEDKKHNMASSDDITMNLQNLDDKNKSNRALKNSLESEKNHQNRSGRTSNLKKPNDKNMDPENDQTITINNSLSKPSIEDDKSISGNSVSSQSSSDGNNDSEVINNRGKQAESIRTDQQEWPFLKQEKAYRPVIAAVIVLPINPYILHASSRDFKRPDNIESEPILVAKANPSKWQGVLSTRTAEGFQPNFDLGIGHEWAVSSWGINPHMSIGYDNFQFNEVSGVISDQTFLDVEEANDLNLFNSNADQQQSIDFNYKRGWYVGGGLDLSFRPHKQWKLYSLFNARYFPTQISFNANQSNADGEIPEMGASGRDPDAINQLIADNLDNQQSIDTYGGFGIGYKITPRLGIDIEWLTQLNKTFVLRAFTENRSLANMPAGFSNSLGFRKRKELRLGISYGF